MPRSNCFVVRPPHLPSFRSISSLAGHQCRPRQSQQLTKPATTLTWGGLGADCAPAAKGFSCRIDAAAGHQPADSSHQLALDLNSGAAVHEVLPWKLESTPGPWRGALLKRPQSPTNRRKVWHPRACPGPKPPSTAVCPLQLSPTKPLQEQRASRPRLSSRKGATGQPEPCPRIHLDLVPETH